MYLSSQVRDLRHVSRTLEHHHVFRVQTDVATLCFSRTGSVRDRGRTCSCDDFFSEQGRYPTVRNLQQVVYDGFLLLNRITPSSLNFLEPQVGYIQCRLHALPFPITPLCSFWRHVDHRGRVTWRTWRDASIARPWQRLIATIDSVLFLFTRPTARCWVRPRVPRTSRRRTWARHVPVCTSTRTNGWRGTPHSSRYRSSAWSASRRNCPCRSRCDVCSDLSCCTCLWLQSNSASCYTTRRSCRSTTPLWTDWASSCHTIYERCSMGRRWSMGVQRVDSVHLRSRTRCNTPTGAIWFDVRSYALEVPRSRGRLRSR